MNISFIKCIFRKFVVYLTIIAFLTSCTAWNRQLVAGYQQRQHAQSAHLNFVLGKPGKIDKVVNTKTGLVTYKFSSFKNYPGHEAIAPIIHNQKDFIQAINILLTATARKTKLSENEYNFVKNATNLNEAISIIQDSFSSQSTALQFPLLAWNDSELALTHFDTPFVILAQTAIPMQSPDALQMSDALKVATENMNRIKPGLTAIGAAIVEGMTKKPVAIGAVILVATFIFLSTNPQEDFYNLTKTFSKDAKILIAEYTKIICNEMLASGIQVHCINLNVNLNDGQGNDKEDNQDHNIDNVCDKIYAADTATCNTTSNIIGRQAGAICHASAAERYAACLHGKQMPPLTTF